LRQFRIESNSKYSIRFEISNIRTALAQTLIFNSMWLHTLLFWSICTLNVKVHSTTVGMLLTVYVTIM